MLTFHYPELFLCVVPVAWAFWRWGRLRGVNGWLRGIIVLLLLLAVTGPSIRTGGRGIDIIVVADRSRSITADAAKRVHELVSNLDANRRNGDRVGIITFGAGAQVERVLSETATFADFTKQVSADGSDLNEALSRAMTLVQPDRPARVLVLSDGEYNGADPLEVARLARDVDVPIDVRSFARTVVGDTAVESVLLPETVAPGEPFQFSAVVTSDGGRDATIRAIRSGKILSTRSVQLLNGRNRVIFRDVIADIGFPNYTIEIDVPGDPLPENDRGIGSLRVDAGPRALVLNDDGRVDHLVAVLRAASIPTDVAAASTHSVTQDALDPYRAVIIENVPAGAFGRRKMDRLAQFVNDLGGGLMLTGGRQSFGVGGYFNSPLDPVLPVSMELREEHRRNRVAMAIALDRSGSMAMPVKGSLIKMDLANRGTAEVIRLLSPGDKVAVIAVDSAPHVVEPLGDVKNREAMISRVQRIQSEGEGIYIYEALVAAGKELLAAQEYATRHIILFSDAADSEEPGDYKRLLAEFQKAGITVSVIGLGTPSDPDAKLLEEIAALGRGNIMFSDDAEELPRLFTQDTMSVARNTFLSGDGKTLPGQLVPDARLMGELGTGVLPDVGGYNLSYLKPEATLAAVSRDEYHAPWSAFWYRGIGRAAAVTFEADGSDSGPISDWQGYGDFFATHVRWLLGGEPPGSVFVRGERHGLNAVFSIELDASAEQEPTPTLLVVPPESEGTPPITPDLVWTGPASLEAHVQLSREGTYRTLIRTGDHKFSRGPTVTLPYSPEYMPRLGLPSGERTLREMTILTGGKIRTDVLGVFDDPPAARRMRPLLPWLVGAALLLHVIEIAGRRLSLWQGPARAGSSDDDRDLVKRSLRRLIELPKWRRRSTQHMSSPGAMSPPSASADRPTAPTLGDVLAQAKQQARR